MTGIHSSGTTSRWLFSVAPDHVSKRKSTMSQWSHDGVSCLGRDVEIHIILKAFDGVVGSSGDSDRCSETKHVHSKDFFVFHWDF
jgi:hypothetical protein